MSSMMSGVGVDQPASDRLVSPPVLVCLVWAVAWLATVPLGDMSLNDDWVYATAVRSIVDHGRFTLEPWSAANVIGQACWGAAWAWLLGTSYDVLRLSTAVTGELALLATYWLSRELDAARGTAAFAALTVGLGPLFLSQSVTFMTDVPFLAVVTVALACFVHARRCERPAFLLAANPGCGGGWIAWSSSNARGEA